MNNSQSLLVDHQCISRELVGRGNSCILKRMEGRFEWDPAKAEVNERKHAVSFAEAATVFGDPLSAALADPDHSGREERFLLLGRSSVGRTLVVVAADYGDCIRLVSAREMTPKERRNYEEGTHGAG